MWASSLFFFFQWMSHGLGRVLPTTTQNLIRVSRGSGQGITNRARTHNTYDDGDRLKVSNKRYPFLSNLQPYLTVYACGFFLDLSGFKYHEFPITTNQGCLSNWSISNIQKISKKLINFAFNNADSSKRTRMLPVQLYKSKRVTMWVH